MLRKFSCGILVLDESKSKILLCHATGQNHWDIPKGKPDEGECEIDAAIRECKEECGLLFGRNDLLSIGRHEYNKNKDLVLYSTSIDSAVKRNYVCECTFTDHRGKEIHEMDDWKFVKYTEIPKYCTDNMTKLLKSILLF